MSMAGKVNWSSVMNLANSIIGVGILALPLCIKSLGYFLGPVVLIFAGYCALETSKLLIQAANATKSRSYEQLSMRAFGKSGKKLCELNICLMLFGVLVAFHSVIGDSSSMLAKLLGMQDTANWRLTVQLFALATIELPFSLLRNISSLNVLSVVSLFIYSSFTLFLFTTGMGEWLLETTTSDVPMFDASGILKSFPILTLAFNCQTTLLPIYNELPASTTKRMNQVARYAITFVGGLYMTVGVSGVLAFGSNVDGNVLNNFAVTSIIVLFKLGFLLCIAFSFPFAVYPSRISINSLYQGDQGDPTFMSTGVFRIITCTLIFLSLSTSIIFPRVEGVLGVSGATSGCFIGMIFPALIFLKISEPGEVGRGMAKFILFLGLLTSFFGIISILSPASTTNVNPKHDFKQHISLQNDQPLPIKSGITTLGNQDIVAMLEKLQAELDETKRELRAEKALRIEQQILELKQQLAEQQVVKDQPAAVQQNLVQQNPVQPDPVQQNPVQQNPVQQNPVQQNPVQQNPVPQNPVQVNPVPQNPAQVNPVQQNPAQQDPVQQNPAQQNPVPQNPVQKDPVQDNQVQKDPAQQNPVQQDAVKQNPVQENPVKQVPVQQNPAPQNPVQPNAAKEEPVKAEPVAQPKVAKQEPAPVQPNNEQVKPAEKEPAKEAAPAVAPVVPVVPAEKPAVEPAKKTAAAAVKVAAPVEQQADPAADQSVEEKLKKLEKLEQEKEELLAELKQPAAALEQPAALKEEEAL